MSFNYWVYGLQRSGTNFIDQSIQRANPGSSNGNKMAQTPRNPKWKHSINPPTDLPTNEPIIIVYKSIWNWIDSIISRQVMDYLRTQQTYKIEETDWIIESYSLAVKEKELHKFSINQLVKTYKLFYENWTQLLDTHNAILVQYEDILSDNQQELAAKIGTELGIQPPVFNTKTPAKHTRSFNQKRIDKYLFGKSNPHPEQAPWEHVVGQYLDRDWFHWLQSKTLHNI